MPAIPNGFRLGFDCPNDRYVMDEQICTAITSMLARIGVKIDLKAQTKAKFFAKIQAPNYDTDFYLLGWTPATYDAHNVAVHAAGHAQRQAGRGELRRLFQSRAGRSDRQDRRARPTRRSATR